MDYHLFTGRNTQISAFLTTLAGIGSSWDALPFNQKLGLTVAIVGLIWTMISVIGSLIYKHKRHQLDKLETQARIELMRKKGEDYE